jgi:hypothetical protein
MLLTEVNCCFNFHEVLFCVHKSFTALASLATDIFRLCIVSSSSFRLLTHKPSRQGQEIFLSPTTPVPTLGPTSSPVQCALGFFHRRRRGVGFTTHLHLVLKLRKTADILAHSTHAFIACRGALHVYTSTTHKRRSYIIQHDVCMLYLGSYTSL